MDDISNCPICSNKLRTVWLFNKYLHPINKTANYAERTCAIGMNHSLQLFADNITNKVDFLKLSLNPKYSRYLEIDFLNQRCRISCFKEGQPKHIEIDKIIEPDFPHLIKLKEKVAMFICFS